MIWARRKRNGLTSQAGWIFGPLRAAMSFTYPRNEQISDFGIRLTDRLIGQPTVEFRGKGDAACITPDVLRMIVAFLQRLLPPSAPVPSHSVWRTIELHSHKHPGERPQQC